MELHEVIFLIVAFFLYVAPILFCLWVSFNFSLYEDCGIKTSRLPNLFLLGISIVPIAGFIITHEILNHSRTNFSKTEGASIAGHKAKCDPFMEIKSEDLGLILVLISLLTIFFI